MALDSSTTSDLFRVSTPSNTLAQLSGNTILKPVGNLAFHAYTNTIPTPSTTIKHEQVNFNVGGAYNPSTGLFTAPIGGLYHLKAELMVARIVGDWRLYIGGSFLTRQSIFYQRYTTVYHTLHVDAVVLLNVGSYALVQYTGPANTVSSVANNFSGHFIG